MTLHHLIRAALRRATKHRAATTPPGRAATAGAVPPPSAPADLSPADLARGTMGAEWIATELTRADEIARLGDTP
jgi:hypothetical protein